MHLATHQGPGGGEANIAKVAVQLPVILPSRTTTLQQACTSAQFDADPARCPQGSFVGTAIAHTPILAAPLSSPAILVSHGGQAFPDLVLVLQGEGVRIDLTGPGRRNLCPVAAIVLTNKRVTRVVNGHARTVAVKVRRTVAPPLLMPTTLTAQNGAQLTQTTKIAVTGCPAAKSAARAARHA